MNGHTLFTAANLSASRFPEAVSKNGDLGYLYIVAFDSGLTKVGYTAQPQHRIHDHISAAAIHGVTPISVWISKPHANANANESALLALCRTSAVGQLNSEYFTGLKFADAIDHALSLTFHPSRDEHLAQIRESLPRPAPEQMPRRVAEAERSAKKHAAEDARWAKKINAGRARAMTNSDFEKFMERIDRAEETNRLLTALLGVQRITSSHLPRVLRRAADRLEQARGESHGFLIDDWDRLLPGGVDNKTHDAGPNPFAPTGAKH